MEILNIKDQIYFNNIKQMLYIFGDIKIIQYIKENNSILVEYSNINDEIEMNFNLNLLTID